MAQKIKIPGALFKQFYDDPKFWPDDDGETFTDDVLLSVNGVEMPDGVNSASLKDSDLVVIEYGGYVGGRGCSVGLDDYYLQWLAEQTTSSFLVACPRENEAALKEVILAAGLGASIA